MREQRCETCRFWDNELGYGGYSHSGQTMGEFEYNERVPGGHCHRYPPLAVVEGMERAPFNQRRYPGTMSDDWCGEWQAITETPKISFLDDREILVQNGFTFANARYMVSSFSRESPDKGKEVVRISNMLRSLGIKWEGGCPWAMIKAIELVDLGESPERVKEVLGLKKRSKTMPIIVEYAAKKQPCPPVDKTEEE
jgi:hypothetical protein